MTASMSEKLGVSSAEPIPPPGGIDELHEAFLLLNAEHRQAQAEARAEMTLSHPILAY